MQEYRVKVHAMTPRGEFWGFVGPCGSLDEVSTAAAELALVANDLHSLTLIAPSLVDGTSQLIFLNQTVLKESVLMIMVALDE